MKPSTTETPIEVRLATFALTATATVVTQTAVADPGEPAARPLIAASALLAASAIAHAWAGRREALRSQAAATAAMAIGLAVPLALAAGRAALSGRSGPLEPALLASLRNLGLVLAATSRRRSMANLAAVVSLFLILASASTTDAPLVVGAMGFYALVGAAWLVVGHWRGLRLSGGGARRVPAAPFVGALALVGLAIAAAAAGPTRAAVALAGFFPSSGGNGGNDPEARGGVGDGDDEVKGAENPESIGYADTDAYLDTDRPSLYDAFNDMYGEPSKPKRVDRMVALSNQNVVEQRERPAENLKASRQFSAARRGRPRGSRGRPADREARALLHVQGRTPLHIGLAAYNVFDGRTWTEAGPPGVHLPLTLERRGGPWLRLWRPASSALGELVSHTIKVAALDSSTLPAPAHLEAFRMGEVDRPDFFGWAAEGLVKMDGRTIPSSTVVESEARLVDVDALGSLAFAPPRRAADDPPLGPAATALLRDWTGVRPEGWSRVEAVVAGLRGLAVVDPEAVAPADCDDVVEHFVRARRGPDYLFATTAAAMLRAAGFSARLVSGLYAAPGRYDPKTRHTAVSAEDVHVWAEVRLAEGTWIAIEPTPGYEILRPAPSGWSRVAAGLGDAWRRLAGRPGTALAIGAFAVAAFAARRRTADALATLAWRVRLQGPPRRVVLRTLALVERRARLGGRPRPAGETLRRWYGPMAFGPDAGADLARLLALAEWGLYAPDGPVPAVGDPRDACRRAVRSWTAGRFRRQSNLGSHQETST